MHVAKETVFIRFGWAFPFLRPLLLVALSTGMLTALQPAAAHAQATSWNARQDFSATANPNGAWSYGWSAHRGGAFTPLPTTANPGSVGGLNCWTGAPSGSIAPDVCHNATTATINPAGTNPVPPGAILFHPGPSGQNADVRWTAPSCGSYDVNATFSGLDDVGPTTSDVAVLHGDTPLFAGNVIGFGAQQVFSGAVAAQQGDTLDFTVGFGPNGNFFFDSTSLDVKISLNSLCDTIAPTTLAALSPVPNANGWNNSDVGVTLNATDNQGGSGVKQIAFSATGSQPVASTTVPGSLASLTVSKEGATVVSYSATDNAGNLETPKSATIRLDKTPPVVTYAGNPGSFNVDQTVNITCSAADPSASDGSAGSGLAFTTCKDITGPAYGFSIGSNSYSASASDEAGNTGTGSTHFTVAVTADGIDGLIGRFVTDAGIASSLKEQVTSIATAPNANSKQGKLQAFTSHVNAQSGKALTSSEASVLIRLAGDL